MPRYRFTDTFYADYTIVADSEEEARKLASDYDAFEEGNYPEWGDTTLEGVIA